MPSGKGYNYSRLDIGKFMLIWHNFKDNPNKIFLKKDFGGWNSSKYLNTLVNLGLIDKFVYENTYGYRLIKLKRVKE